VIWTVTRNDATRCGACGRVIAADRPMQLLTARMLVRCVDCAHGVVNHEEVDLERERIRMERERPPQEHRHGFATFGDLKLPFDPKKAAAGDRE
jgi:hypothetical protein